MGLLLAAALAAHIQTDRELLVACQHHQQACDTFIQQVVAARDLTACIDLSAPDELRDRLVVYLTSPEPKKRIVGTRQYRASSARDAVLFGLGFRCAVD